MWSASLAPTPCAPCRSRLCQPASGPTLQRPAPLGRSPAAGAGRQGADNAQACRVLSLPSLRRLLLRRGTPAICGAGGTGSEEGPAVADLEVLLKESSACGVGFIASLKNEKSHDTILKALRGLGCMEHRGACLADYDSGDGAGVMSQVPWAILKKQFPDLDESTTGVGMVFLPNDDDLEAESRAIVEEVVSKEGLTLLGWRDVPVDPSVVGRIAKATMPRIAQVLIAGGPNLKGDELERELFITRRKMEQEAIVRLGDRASDFYICTLSSRVIVYKGMLRSSVLADFYKDLTDPDYIASFAVYHRRFSTNTNPKWPLAQPMRFLGHNGEINTLQGNLNWVASREHTFKNPIWKNREEEFTPICNPAESDSANLDHVAEVLVRSGVSAAKSVMLLVPEAYRNHPDLDKNYPEVIDFYEFYEGLQEGWDGPALLVFSDGVRIGARLDRNGLRPARYWETSDGYAYMASEVGVLGDTLSNAANVTEKGRLGPGQMIYVDLEAGTFMENTEVARTVAASEPYGEWLKSSRRLNDFSPVAFSPEASMPPDSLLRMQSGYGLGLEDAQLIVETMASSANEPIFCMGDDTPLPVLSEKPHLLYNYFKQRFAQVTNPAIDPLREGLVMSLSMRLGAQGNLLGPSADSYKQVFLKSPILTESQMTTIAKDKGLGSSVFVLHYQSGKDGALAAAVAKLCEDVEVAVRNGCQCVVLSDRVDSAAEMDPQQPPIPALLATGAVHHHLIRKYLRTETSIVVETAQCFSTHHLAVLIGYGAHAVCPYLTFETCRQWRLSPRTQNLINSGKLVDIPIQGVQKNFKKAMEKGLLKILSKMGISLLSCYHGAQIFEIYGLGSDLVDVAFRGSVSRIGGMTMDDLQRETEALWAKAFPEKAMKKLEDYGFIQSKPRGEFHANNQAMAKLLHKSIGLGNGAGAQPEAYQAFKDHFLESPVAVLRDCLEFVSDKAPISVDEVEPASAIMARFCTGGMSLGAISRETHETIAIAMNRIGGKSNSGEGGEDPVRWEVLNNVDSNGKSETLPHLNGLRNGDTASSAIKQVASGRFGVTPQFLVNSDQLEIKIAQGAKPGEGGQLPGKKVSPYIAGLRRSKAGVPLISPPPHHDIYSIEDLAQLIYDLHQVSPHAKVSVKLVAEAGIGTVASGVAKASADVIQVSGHDGGTGASPVSSIKHAGGPVEMGVAEVHQSLVGNGLRDRVVVRVDGGIRSGVDVLKMAAIGADEFGFGTVAMIATGCIMARVCHTNNCPVGVATQREDLRARFPGVAGDLVRFFEFVAEEVRCGLADLGLRSLDELIGRADLLQQRGVALAKTTHLDLSFVTTYAGPPGVSSERLRMATHENGEGLWDDRVLAEPDVLDCIENERTLTKKYEIVNTDRAALGRISGAIAKRYGDRGFTGCLNLVLRGSGGQSFGCFLVGGMDVQLTGEANDYVGKSMAGGDITIVPPPESQFASDTASLVGNTCLYGATGGRLFVNGRAGERFAVRNSMAEAVVEGTGDHCCEYMTGGCVVSLGTVGRNVGAGMTGGLAYFYDEAGDFPEKVNTEIVSIQRLRTPAGEEQLRSLIEAHVEKSGSVRGRAILDDWPAAAKRFWQLVPPSEQNSPEANPEVAIEVGSQSMALNPGR
ncbi:unnamed protein product [Ostreobium quekettii]|uniref:glutamate synthase (ferredoxin) n=1 Tax=Ostreobium quekettii TaxID=121088 RepID=A0A8S1J472_9CHLO|nr:unnamed protein product [Ostreobium quekettii]|eukprot:evm.model.scf_626EXC.5 EVM.evm.TU.scf_626EXC.5   scf_626EXC:28488-43663(+)